MPLTFLAHAAAHDVKVVLCGEGADEIFGGYKRYQISRWLGRAAAMTGLATSPFADGWGMRRSGSANARAAEAVLWGGGLRGHAALLDGDLPLLRRIRPDVHQDLLDLLRTDWTALPVHDSLQRAQTYDRTRWLPNVYLEKTDRATMSAGLEARVPFLDPVVITAAAPPDRSDHRKTPLRELLSRVAPTVVVPMNKRGLAVDAESTVLRFLHEPFRFELEDRRSVLHRWAGASGALEVRARARRSPTLAFRVAMLGVWEQEFGGERFTCS
jgi:asparagine synthase (glutamine-hydrolysing)